jgi:hypothetical protein
VGKDASADAISSGNDDASPDGSADPNVCAPGAFAVPLRAFDATPEAKGRFCNLDGALAKDDSIVAGLDRNDETANVFLDGIGITTCVGVEIVPRALSEVVVRAAAAEVGCDGPCTPGAGGCDSHQWVEVFAAAPAGAFQHLGRVDTNRTLADYVVTIPGGFGSVDRIAVCRSDGGKPRDDEVVDFIGARCL